MRGIFGRKLRASGGANQSSKLMMTPVSNPTKNDRSRSRLFYRPIALALSLWRISFL